MYYQIPILLSKNQLSKHDNIDLLTPTYDLYQSLSEKYSMQCLHTPAHGVAPSDPVEYYNWYYNDIVDKICDSMLSIKK